MSEGGLPPKRIASVGANQLRPKRGGRGEVRIEDAVAIAGFFGGQPLQCDMSTGRVMDDRSSRVVPPNSNSRAREWP